jgi:2-phosphosulfolactate phosphatase
MEIMIDVAFTWQELKDRDLTNSVVVVADILRATTVMVTALTNGAYCILPQASEEAARTKHKELIAQGIPALLCGEREGLIIEGFDFGNSPREFVPDAVNGKTIVHLTTNGTRALNQCMQAKQIYIASFLNRRAVANLLMPHLENHEDILFVASGKESFFCLEDTVCLGGIVDEILSNNSTAAICTDAATAAQLLYQTYQPTLTESMQKFSHAAYLADVGLEDDIPLCAIQDTSTLVPMMQDGMIVPSASEPCALSR